MLYKACPKCRGDLGLEHGIYGGPPDLVCVQCGYTARPQEQLTLLTRLVDQGAAHTHAGLGARPAPACVIDCPVCRVSSRDDTLYAGVPQ